MEIAERLVPPLQRLADSGSAAARSPLVCQQAEVIDGGERREFRAPGKFTLSAYLLGERALASVARPSRIKFKKTSEAKLGWKTRGVATLPRNINGPTSAWKGGSWKDIQFKRVKLVSGGCRFLANFGVEEAAGHIFI